MVKSYPKIKPYRDKKYLEWIRRHGCLACGAKASAHHVRRSYWGAGMGVKPHDYVTLPLCEINGHHNPRIEKKIDVECVIIRNLVQYAKEYRDKRELIQTLMDFIHD